MVDRPQDDLRRRVLSTALGATAIGAPSIAVWMMAFRTGPGPSAISGFLFAYTLLFPLLYAASPRLTLPTVGSSYLALMLLMAFAIQLRGGLSVASASLQLVVVVLSALLFGTRGVLVGLGLNLLTVCVAAFAVVRQQVPPIALEFWNPLHVDLWVRGGIVLTAFGAASALAIVYTIHRLEEEAGLLEQALGREREQRLALERAEAERERARAILSEAERVEALGRIASGVAHDFNNMLTVIVGSAEVAQLSPDLPGEVRSCLDDITRASAQAAELTRSLLVLGRRDIAQPRAIGLRDHLPGMLRTLRRLLPIDIDLSISCDEHARIFADPTQLDRALLNVVVNARDSIQGAGKIAISGRVLRLGDAERIDLAAGEYVALCVRDTGCGMNPEVKRRIFEPYFTTKSVGAGTGIGMAMVEGFARSTGGGVEVDSSPGSGTTVTFYLPQAQLPGASASATHEPTSSGVRSSGAFSILVVEDNAAVLARTEAVLRRAGFTVISAEDGDRALELVDDEDLHFDLLCIDGVIPGARSSDVIERVRQRRPDTAVVVCSGYVDEELLRRGIQSGSVACVRKPYTASALVACVKRELGVAEPSAAEPS